MPWRFLAFLLKGIEKYDNVSFIEAAKNTVNIAIHFYPYLKQAICAFYMFEKLFWNLLDRSKQFKDIFNLFLYPCRLFQIEVCKILPVK